MRIIAFSDWRTQDFDILEDAFKTIDPMPDVIVYSGDDIDRFEDLSLDNVLEKLKNASIQDIGLHDMDSKCGCLIDSDVSGEYYIPVIPLSADDDANIAKKKMKECLLYYKKLGKINHGFMLPNIDSYYKELVHKNIKLLSFILSYYDLMEKVRGNWTEELLKNFDIELVEIDSKKYGVFHDSLKKSSNNIFQELAKYSKKGVLAVIGNDDDFSYKWILKKENIRDLHENPISIGKYTFLGMEGGSTDTNQLIGNVLYSESEIAKHLELQAKMAKGKVILVSHTPPYKILDFAKRHGAENIGSKSIKKFIKENNVILNICGHVHLYGGRSETFESCLVVNASSTESDLYGKVALIDIDEKTDEIGLEWLDLRDYNLSQLYQVGPTRSRKLKDLGIETLDDILNVDKSVLVKNFGEGYAKIWMNHAKALKYKKPSFFKPLELPKGLIFYDIETTLTEDKLVWLIGVYDSLRNEFKQFIAKNPKDEKKILKEFIEFIEKTPSGTLCCYSGTYFDKRTILSRIKLFDENLATIFDKRDHIDLCMKLRACVMLPTYGFSLDEVSDHFEYKCKQPSLDGFIVGDLYGRYLDGCGEPPWDYLLEYNADDVMVLPFIIDKLCNLQK